MRKRRRRNSEENALDLHGIRHRDVDLMVENHVFLSRLPVTIITGHSEEMKNIVRQVLDRNNFKYMDGLPHNHGCIIVVE